MKLAHWTWILLFGWLGINSVLLPRFPTAFIDEAENANHAYNLMTRGEAVFSLYDGLYPPTHYDLRQSWPVVIRPFFSRPLSWWMQLTGFSFTKARGFSLGVAFGALLLFFWIGRRLLGPPAAFWALALLSTRFLWFYCADRIRPEMLLALWGLGVFAFLLLAQKSKRPWAILAAAFLAGSAAGVHTNGVTFAVPLFGILLWEKQWKAAFVAALGWAAGFGCFLLAADWNRFLPGLKALFFNEFSSPSITRFHGNIFAAFVDEADRYFTPWIYDHWRGGVYFHLVMCSQYLIYTAGLVWAARQKAPVRIAARYALLLALAFTLIVGQKSFPYIVLLEPFFVLALTAWLQSQEKPQAPALLAALSFILILFPLSKYPVMILVPLALLPKKAFQWAALIVAITFFLRADLLRTWLLEAPRQLVTYWPLIGLAAALSLYRWRRGEKIWKPSAFSLAWTGTALITVATLSFVASAASYRPSLPELTQRLASQMRPGALVAGPQTFWLGLHQFNYRDLGGITWFRLLRGDRDLVSPIDRLHPDYLILNREVAERIASLNIARDAAKAMQPPTGLFPWPHRIIDLFDTGPAYGGEMILIENQWPAAKR